MRGACVHLQQCFRFFPYAVQRRFSLKARENNAITTDYHCTLQSVNTTVESSQQRYYGLYDDAAARPIPEGPCKYVRIALGFGLVGCSLENVAETKQRRVSISHGLACT